MTGMSDRAPLSGGYRNISEERCINYMKKRSSVQILSAIMALSLLLPSCSQGTVPEDTEKETDSGPDGFVGDTTADDGYAPPDKDFGGRTLNFYMWTENKFSASEETGDIIEDAVYKRNRKVEELFNVSFTYDIRTGDWQTWKDWIGVLNSSILAGDDAYQLVGGYGYRLARETLGDTFQNLKENPYIDFSKPWWPANITDAANAGSRVGLCFGNLDPNFYDTTYAVYFNKKLADDNSIGNMYDLVYDGKWTLDKLFEFSEAGARDLDGDTIIGENDQYGLILDKTMSVDAFLQSSDIMISEKDADGIPTLLGLSEKLVDLQESLRDFIYRSGSVLYEADDMNLLTGVFMSGRSLFFANNLSRAHTLRDMNDDFGIIPYPKYDEAQDGYKTYNAIGNSTAFAIPTGADSELAGCVIEALAYYGWNDILPEYYERALKGKVARDNDSEAMLDLIMDNIEFDFIQIYSYCFAFKYGDKMSPSLALRMSVQTDSELTSFWASNQNIYDEIMSGLITSIS